MEKIDLNKLKKIWNPFNQIVWFKLDSPITRREIKDAIKNKQFISPNTPVKKEGIWDLSTFISKLYIYLCSYEQGKISKNTPFNVV